MAILTAAILGLPPGPAAAIGIEAARGTTERVSVRSDGSEVPDAGAWGGAISDDGRVVAFTSEGRLHDADRDWNSDVYLHHVVDGWTRIVSVTDAEGEIETAASLIGMTADARLVFFLVWTGGSDAYEVLVRDRNAGTTTPVVAGVQDAAVSSDGAWLAYTVRTLDEEGSPVLTRLRLLDVAAGTWSLVYRTRRAVWTYSVADTGDVAFDSDAEVVPGGGGDPYEMDTFLWTRADGSVRLLSGDLPGFQNHAPSITRDGDAVAFWTDAGQMGAPGFAVWERTGGDARQVVVVPVRSEVFWNVGILTPDERFLAYTGGTSRDTYQTRVTVLDRDTGVLERVDVNDFGRTSPRVSVSFVMGITPDGRYVSFTSGAGDLVPADTNRAADVFVRDRLGVPIGAGAPDLAARERESDRVAGVGEIDAVGDDTPLQLWDVDRGDVRQVSLSIRNVGNAQDRFSVLGRGTVRGVRVRYRVERVDVTDAVVAGTFLTAVLPPDARFVIHVRIEISDTARRCTRRVFPLRSDAEGSAWTDALAVEVFLAC